MFFPFPCHSQQPFFVQLVIGWLQFIRSVKITISHVGSHSSLPWIQSHHPHYLLNSYKIYNWIQSNDQKSFVCSIFIFQHSSYKITKRNFIRYDLMNICFLYIKNYIFRESWRTFLHKSTKNIFK